MDTKSSSRFVRLFIRAGDEIHRLLGEEQNYVKKSRFKREFMLNTVKYLH